MRLGDEHDARGLLVETVHDAGLRDEDSLALYVHGQRLSHDGKQRKALEDPSRNSVFVRAAHILAVAMHGNAGRLVDEEAAFVFV